MSGIFKICTIGKPDEIPLNPPRRSIGLGACRAGVLFMRRETLTRAVNLAICLDRGYYLGTVARDKQTALDDLKRYMTADEINELNRRAA